MRDTQTSPYTGRPVVDWYDYEIKLRDADGDKIGDVVEVNPDFIVCESDGGFLGLGERRRYFVPRNYISREDRDDWYLSVDKDQIESMNWTNTPTNSAWGSEWSTGDYSGDTTNAEGRTRLRRYEEDVDVSKVQREAGEVVVNKRVVEDTKTVEVPVRREEVHVERRPIDDREGVTADAFSNEAFTEDSVRVPVMAEDVEVRKVTRPVEEIELTKTAVDESRNVDTTVRREEFDVDDSTDTRIR
jgi:uncharacterized protein (TIGR02271 family)